MDYQSKNHVKFLILYHLIFVCKYRKKLLVFYGNEVKQLFEENELKRAFWKERTFWSDGYQCCTIGNASQETIRQYSESQG